jgi:hypothetical protein
MIEARLGEQIELQQQTLVNRIPSAARPSIAGVCTYGFSHQP